jgi:hypothetical protein
MKIDMNRVNPYNKKFLTVLLNNDSFKEEIIKSQQLFQPTVKKNKEKIVSWNESVLECETHRIMQLFGNIPDSWQESIKQFIKTGELIPPDSSTAPLVVLESADMWGKSSLNMQIFKHTTKKEYIETWKQVKALQGEMIEFKPKPISKKEMKIIELRKQGKTEIEIYNDVNGVKLANIRKIISRKAPQLGVTQKSKKS